MDVICECKGPVIYAGLGQVAGSGTTLEAAFANTISECGRLGLAIGVLNGLNSCSAYPGN